MSHHNITADDFEITPEKIERFKEKVKEFYFNLAKGQECLVRHYDEEDQEVIVVIHGSYKRSVVIWDGQQIRTLFSGPLTRTFCSSIKIPPSFQSRLSTRKTRSTTSMPLPKQF